MFKYIFQLTHDYGRVNMSVVAHNESTARFMIQEAEHCPNRAIKLLNFKQINQ